MARATRHVSILGTVRQPRPQVPLNRALPAVLVALLLAACNQERLSDLILVPGVPTIIVSPVMVKVDEPITVTVASSATVSLNMYRTDLSYGNQTGFCVYEGQKNYADISTLDCAEQTRLPAGVVLGADSTMDTFATTLYVRGELTTFKHEAKLKFARAGIYTIFGRQIIYGVPGNRQTVYGRLVTPQPQIITVD